MHILVPEFPLLGTDSKQIIEDDPKDLYGWKIIT